jgi:UDP-glucuronate decarboxylase
MSKRAIFDKKNILVTGGAGFIGSHLCDELVKASKVICVDNFSTGDEKNIDHLLADPNFEFIKHDMSEPIDLEKFPELDKFKVKFQGVQEIYNLACPTSPKNFTENKIASILANSEAVKNVLDLAVKYNAKILQFSSSVVYGPRQNDNLKVVEEKIGEVDILSPRACYDEGKRFAETMVATYRDVYKIDTKIIRVFRIYGPRMKLDDGNMIPDFIDSALEDKELIIFGNKNFSSSFCYISDCIDAAVKLMDSNLSGPINIGSDAEVNIVDLAEKIISLLGSKSKIKYEQPLIFMTPLNLPDVTKARNQLGWLPVVTLEKGLEKTIENLRAGKGLMGVRNIL